MKDKSYLERMVKYSTKIIKYMDGVKSFEEFEVNEEKMDAIVLNLEQIGETAKKLSFETKEKFSSIKWPSIIGLRNMISHDYEGIKLTIIFEIATKNIPELLENLIHHESFEKTL
jgi:uncharacterized protein with HEPN domain